MGAHGGGCALPASGTALCVTGAGLHSESTGVLPGPHGDDFIACLPDVAAGELLPAMPRPPAGAGVGRTPTVPRGEPQTLPGDLALKHSAGMMTLLA